MAYVRVAFERVAVLVVSAPASSLRFCRGTRVAFLGFRTATRYLCCLDPDFWLRLSFQLEFQAFYQWPSTVIRETAHS